MVGRRLAALALLLALFAGLFAALAAPALAEGNLRLSILADPGLGRPVEGEMVAVTIRGVYDRKIANEKIEIDPTDAFDWIQTRQDDWREEMIDGLSHIVFERHLAIWPKRAGPLQFGPARHRLTIITRQGQREDVVVEAQPLTISVAPFPQVKGWHFTGRRVELTDTLSTDAARLADGEIATRRVTLRVLGALPEHLPPRPVVSENWLITFAAPVQRNLTLTADGPVAEAIWTWQFRPHTGEPGVLEPVTIPFFDTVGRRMDSVQIPALAIGYASFYTGQTPTGRIGAAAIWTVAAAMAAGLALGLGLATLRLAPEATAAGLARLRMRWSPFPRLRMWRAARRGDLLALRRAAEDAGASPERIAEIERAIYGPPG